MRDNPVMQVIWGIGNHRAFDLFPAFWMILLFLIDYIRNPRNEDRAALIQFGLYMTVTLLIAVAVAELTINFQRLSPGATEELKSRAIVLTDLTDRIAWKVKIGSSNSFPGDHAMVLMFIGSYIIYRLRSWYGWAAGFGMALFVLPRLAGGGHWLSDILAGSLFFYLLLFPLFMLEPVRERALALLRRLSILMDPNRIASFQKALRLSCLLTPFTMKWRRNESWPGNEGVTADGRVFGGSDYGEPEKSGTGLASSEAYVRKE